MTETDVRPTGDTGEVTSSPSPVSPYDEFVITDAPLPDHSQTPDEDAALSTRSPERTDRLKSLTGGLSAGRRGRPRKEAAPKPAKVPKRVPPMPRGGFTEQLEQLYVGVGMALLLKDPECGMAVIEAAPQCAKTLNALAEKNPAVRRILIALTQSSAIGAVVIAHAPILWAISKHHVPAVRDSNIVSLVDGLLTKGSQSGEPEAA